MNGSGVVSTGLVSTGLVSTAEVAEFIARLALGSGAAGDGERIDRIGALEELKAAAAAAQAVDVVAFADSQLAQQADHGVRAKDRGLGVASQIGLACRQSPHRGSRMLATARTLLADLPHTLSALARGETSEFRAMVIVKETAVLEPGQRRVVDAELVERLPGLGDRAVETAVRRATCRLAPEAVAARAARAHQDRCVTVRPAPDTMTYVSALLRVRDGVAVYASLDAAAKAAAAAGDERTRGQVMADTLVAHVTGRASGEHPIVISLVMTDSTLLGGGSEPAHVPGYGAVPAEISRRCILSVLDLDAETDDEDDTRHGSRQRARRHRRGQVWLRRLYATPGGAELVAMEARRRHFPGLLRRLIEYRDQVCATPYCGAPIRHIDHTVPVRAGGATTFENGRGTCARCNHAKEAPGWSAAVVDTTAGAERVVTVTTPTGHRYAGRPPRAHRGREPSEQQPGESREQSESRSGSRERAV